MGHFLVNYHNHDDASILDGFSTAKQVVARCKELGMKYAMQTNHGNVAGNLAFYSACKDADIIPLLGTELYLKDEKYDNGKPKGYHLILWAYNEEGLHNLWAISSATYLATTKNHKTPNASWDMFAGHGAGLVCSSACLASMLDQAALKDDRKMADYFCQKCQETFDYFAVELHTNSLKEQHQVNLWLDKYARENNIPTVYAVDAHYARKEDAELHDVWLGCSTKAHFDEQHFRMDHEYYIQDEHEIRERLAYLGEESVERCFDGVDALLSHVEQFKLDSSHKVAKFPIPDGFDNANQYFLYLVEKNLIEKVGGLNVDDDLNISATPEQLAAAQKRMKPALQQLSDEELPLIIDNGLADYFLMVADECSFARQTMLIGPGRGSAAGSLVCYLLGITSINPIGKGLIFSRFLNQGRLGTWLIHEGEDTHELGEMVHVVVGDSVVPLSSVVDGDVIAAFVTWQGKQVTCNWHVDSIEFRAGELPDIDCDFEPSQREKIPAHFAQMYGVDNVGSVGTSSIYSIKSALSDVARYYRIPFNESKKLTAIAGRLEEMAGDDPWESQIDNLNSADRIFIQSYQHEYPKLFKTADRFIGLIRQFGKHAAGYIVSPIPLAPWLPVRKAFSTNSHGDTVEEIISQFDKYQVEALGFVKVDVLGLRNLETLHQVNDLLASEGKVPIDFYNLVDDPHDNAVWSLFEEGHTLGIFQMGGSGITDVARKLQPKSVNDLAAIVAAYRPGVIGAGLLDEYLARARGEKPVEYVCPQLEPILSETYGIILYQEEAIRIFTDLGGFSDSEADQLRAAIGHKNLEQMMACEQPFYEGCQKHNVSLDDAHKIFEQITASSSYSFNRSHSYVYGTIAFWTAYVKAHCPLEFYAASLSTVDSDDVPKYLAEARRMGYAITPPAMSHLTSGYAIAGNAISYGLMSMKGVGYRAVQNILKAAPYKDFADFVARSHANKTVMTTLINGGIFDGENPNRRELLLRYQGNDYEPTLFGDSYHELHAPYPDDRIAELETDIYGMPLTVDSFAPYLQQLGGISKSIMSLDVAEKLQDGAEAPMLVSIEEVREHMSKRGMMAFVTAQTNMYEFIEFTVFSGTYEAAHMWFKKGAIMLVGLVKGQYKGRLSWSLNHLKHFEER